MIPPTSRTLASALALAIALSFGAAAAQAQQDALVIEKDAVKVTTSLSVAGTAAAETFVGMGAMPVGAILMWSGSPDKVPAGWLLCDGTKGTPPLSGRFIVGYDKSDLAEYDVNKAGGEAKHTLTLEEMPAHTHAATASSAGEHQHDIRKSSHGWDVGEIVQSGDTRHAPFGNAKTSSAGAHTHVVTVASAGGGTPHENRPPYYALAYIMFVGVPDGTYLSSCRKAERSENILRAECAAFDGSWKTTNLDLKSCQTGPGSISNQNGQLACIKK